MSLRLTLTCNRCGSSSTSTHPESATAKADARRVALKHGWSRQIWDNRMSDLCPRCTGWLEKEGDEQKSPSKRPD